VALNGRQFRLMPFRALNLSPQIVQAVRDAGYTEPTPIQVAAIPLISAGHDIIGIAQTGTERQPLSFCRF
jgi:ATP-dependent RNA helicase RhlE